MYFELHVNNLQCRQWNLLVRQLKPFLWWYIVFLILRICKLGKVLKACQVQSHCFVIASAPKQVHRTKPNKVLTSVKNIEQVVKGRQN